MNIIELLGVKYKEDIISNLIVGLISESERFRNNFLKNIVGVPNAELYDVEAFTRITTSQGIPDIIIKICNEEESILAIIENKLKAEEGYEQTARYSSEECIKDLCRNNKINLEYKDINKKFIYLTLIPEQIPTGEKFINKTYKDLLDTVNVDIENELLDKVYKDFLILMNDFYSNIYINKEDKLLELLYDNIDDEKVYIRFKNIMKLFKFNNGLNVRHVGKAAGVGRVSFIAQISKNNWVGNSRADFIDGFYKVSENTYDIHIEFSFDILNKVIKLPLHYETNPYIPKNKLINGSRKEDYNKYICRRDLFKEKLHKKIHDLGDKNIKPYNGSNQIANISISIDNDVTVEKFLEIIKENCNTISMLVEDVLLETTF